MSTETALVAIDALKAVDVFRPGGVEKLVTDLEVKVRGLNKAIDPSTDEGRAAAKSLAFKVARSKTGLDELGKEFVAEIKKQSAGIDADRRILWDRLEGLQKEVRKPVDDWETADKARVEAHIVLLDELKGLGEFHPGAEPTVADLDARDEALKPHWQRDWQEFKERADQLLAKVPGQLATMRAAVVKREKDRAELAQLRADQAVREAKDKKEREDREQRERDARIATEAAEKASTAAAESLRVAEQEKANAEERARRAEDARIAAAQQAELDRQAAAERARLATETALQAERARVAAEEAETQRQADARAADTAHRAKINRFVVADLMLKGNVTEDTAKKIVVAIAKGQIRHVTVAY